MQKCMARWPLWIDRLVDWWWVLIIVGVRHVTFIFPHVLLLAFPSNAEIDSSLSYLESWNWEKQQRLRSLSRHFSRARYVCQFPVWNGAPCLFAQQSCGTVISCVIARPITGGRDDRYYIFYPSTINLKTALAPRFASDKSRPRALLNHREMVWQNPTTPAARDSRWKTLKFECNRRDIRNCRTHTKYRTFF